MNISFSAPIVNKKLPQGYENVTLQMVDICSVMTFLFDTVGVDIPIEKVRAFWRHHRAVQSPWVSACGHIDEETIPIGIFGDGARARQQAFKLPEKVVGIFLSLPLWRPKSSRQTRFLVFAIDEYELYGRKTLNQVYARLVWALESMLHGRYPTHDLNGTPLTSVRAGQPITRQGHRFALVEHRGDWSYFRQILGFQGSWVGGVNVPVCFQCSAWKSGPVQDHYYHIHEDAQCWATEYGTVEFLANQMPSSQIRSLLS